MAARRLGISAAAARLYCAEGRWPGAKRRPVREDATREVWYVPKDSVPPLRRPPRILTDEDRKEIGRRKAAGESATKLAREYGLDVSYPYKLAKRLGGD